MRYLHILRTKPTIPILTPLRKTSLGELWRVKARLMPIIIINLVGPITPPATESKQQGIPCTSRFARGVPSTKTCTRASRQIRTNLNQSGSNCRPLLQGSFVKYLLSILFNVKYIRKSRKFKNLHVCFVYVFYNETVFSRHFFVERKQKAKAGG